MSTAAPPKMTFAVRPLNADWRILCCSLSRSLPCRYIPYGTRQRSNTQRAGYPAGLTFPQWTKLTRRWRARLAARRDQKSKPASVLVRRAGIGRRSTTPPPPPPPPPPPAPPPPPPAARPPH